ncbi:MAG: CocE/NonD family hydrolase [Bryobacteraceae bacterium]
MTIGLQTAAAQEAGVTVPKSASHYNEAMLSKPQYKIVKEANVRVPMRDKVTLAADIYRPDAPGKFPAILERTPYGRANAGAAREGQFFAERGYVFIDMDVRGRYDSDGHFYAFKNEANDGFDSDEWIGKQAWFDGNLGTIGGSYVGYTQWMQAVRGSKYLKTAAPAVTTPDIYGNWTWINGVLHYGFTFPWGVDIDAHVDQYAGDVNWPPAYFHLPVATSDEAVGHRVPYVRDWVAHPTRDSYWDGISYEKDYNKIGIPILSVDGWYDIFLRGALQADTETRKLGKTEEARTGKRLIIGPWAHSTGGRYALSNGRSGGAPPDQDRIDFGDNAPINMDNLYLSWYDHWLKGVKNGVDTEAPFQIFVMGENYWRNENEWPLARTKYVNYYIESGGRANSFDGDGVLTADQPKGSATDKFTYDPANPVPSKGGNVCCSSVPSGPWDQRSVERRDDVLVYTTPAMTQPMEITGPLSMKLFASTSAADTDFTAKLVDVHPDGYAQNIQSGIVRARYRNGVSKNPDFIDPDKVYEYSIDMWATSYVILPGHSLRLEVSSSDFPRFDRNLNTRESPENSTKIVVAHQTIYHDAQHPSHVILPLIPMAEGGGQSTAAVR